MSAGSLPKCCRLFIISSASVISLSIVKIGRDCMSDDNKSLKFSCSAKVREVENFDPDPFSETDNNHKLTSSSDWLDQS